MKLQRINQILDGRDFSLQFVYSEYFSNEYVADIRKEKPSDDWLPFPFNIELLQLNDIHLKEEVVTDFLLNNFILEYEKAKVDITNGFGENFQFSVDILKKYLSDFKFDNKFSFLTTYDFPHTSEKIVELYQIMNYIVDYFYFGIIPLKDKKEFITFEFAYE